MFAFIERRFAQVNEARTNRRAQRAARAAFEESCRTARIKLCPGCQVPIEKNEGCDHMHCVLCGMHFSWRLAIPCNMEALDNQGDGRFRLCPHCQYQNVKLHSLTEARCSRCDRDFVWDNAAHVPMTHLGDLPRTRNRAGAVGGENDCGAGRALPQLTSPAVRAWLNDSRRPCINPAIPIEGDYPVVNEAIRCEICSSRPKSYALQCGHLFCEECLVTFLRDHPTCPIDRSIVAAAPIKIYF